MVRPREYDREKIFNDFVSWAKDNPDALTVPQFATSIGINSEMLNVWARENPLFQQAFLVGKELIGINRLKASMNFEEKKLDKSIYMQTLGNYDQDVRLYQRSEKRYEKDLKAELQELDHKLKTEEVEQVSADVKAQYDVLMKQISSLQSSSSKADESNNNKDK